MRGDIPTTLLSDHIALLKYHKKWAKFGKLMSELIDDVVSLHVGYCKCEPLTNQDDFKGGGWLKHILGIADLW